MVAIDRLRKNYVQSHTDNLSGADHLSSKKNLARKTAPKDLEFGRRFFLAWKDLEKREEKDIPFAEIGARVAAVLRRDDDYSHATVHGWRSGTRPDSPVIRALAVVLGCDEDWLLRTGSGPDGSAGRGSRGA